MSHKSHIAFLLLLLTVLQVQGQEITFSKAGGFYDSSFNLELYCNGDYSIRYTTNGGCPTKTSPCYTQPLLLTESFFSKSDIYSIVNCIPSTYYAVEDVERAIVIRAAAFDEDGTRVSPVATQTYCIKSLGCDLHGLPVLSIAADSLDLFDFETGIFIPGVHYDPADSTGSGNYNMTGREWERQVNVEFYETDNIGINQQCGLRTHGGASRWFQQKGMRIYARDEYGKKRFKHTFFETTTLDSFKRLNLHPFRCSNWWQTGGQEYLSQCVAAKMNVDGLGVRQTVVFINGEYWGIYTLEESPDERYLEDHYGVDINQVNIIKYWGVTNHGDGMDWWRFRNWLENADLNQPSNSAYAFSRMDVSNFIDYILLETYGANLDWPQNNVLQWQACNGEPFRMIFFDGDGCFTRWYYKALYNAYSNDLCGMVVRKYLESDSFARMLYDRYMELKLGTFNNNQMKQLWDEYRQQVEAEVPQQSERFGFPRNMRQWQSDMDSTEAFFTKRFAAFDQEIKEMFELDEHILEDVSVYPNPNEGSFAISLTMDGCVIVPVEMYDVLGRLVFTEDCFLMSGKNVIPINVNLRAGVYQLRLGSVVRSIIIQ